MNAIRWGIIGSGKIAKRFAGDLKFLAGAKLAGVTSRNRENCALFAREFSTTAYRTLEELLNTDVDVVYVATPHTSHLEHALAALNAGKPVLCEKSIGYRRVLCRVRTNDSRRVPCADFG